MRRKWAVKGKTILDIDGDTITDTECRTWCVHIIPVAFLLVLAFWGINRLADSFKILVNPEFYAIKNLILILLGKG